jgi:hypothetical protein
MVDLLKKYVHYQKLEIEKVSIFSMKTKPARRGGKREGSGRKSQGKERFTVTLTADFVDRAKSREQNFSGLLDRLLSEWLRARSEA